MMLRYRNERKFGRSRQFFRFAGTASSSAKISPSSNSAVTEGFPTRGGVVRCLIDGTIFMSWILIGAFCMWLLGTSAPKYTLKNTCKDSDVFR
jgi:hypothetical protein